MKLISWNVNGLRACLTHDFAASFAALDADIFSVQETKMQPGQADFAPEGYTEYTYSAEKKGYSGTACWCRQPPLAVTTGIGIEEHDHEGRVLTLEYPAFYLVNCYTPNSQDGLKRLDYRMTWEDAFRAYLLALDAKKPVILCGDLNVAHTEQDIKNAKTNRMSAGFTDQERAKMTELLEAGFADSFRVLHPDEVKYSWWVPAYRTSACAPRCPCRALVPRTPMLARLCSATAPLTSRMCRMPPLRPCWATPSRRTSPTSTRP